MQPIPVLQQFIRSDSSGRRVKLENLRYRLLRGMKKTIRGIISNGKKNVAKKLLPASCTHDQPDFVKLKEWCCRLQTEAEEFARLGNGPKVDAQRCVRVCEFTTYNNSYLRAVFSSPAIRLLYRLFVNVILSDQHPDSLAKQLSIRCCAHSSAMHTQVCTEKWTALYTVLHRYLGAEVTDANETVESLERLLGM